jgi:hypothetical protein
MPDIVAGDHNRYYSNADEPMIASRIADSEADTFL